MPTPPVSALPSSSYAPVPPPMKKQRSATADIDDSTNNGPTSVHSSNISTGGGGTMDATEIADDGIARRRAELRRLQRLRDGFRDEFPGRPTTSPTTSSGSGAPPLVGGAFSGPPPSLGGGGGPPTMLGHNPRFFGASGGGGGGGGAFSAMRAPVVGKATTSSAFRTSGFSGAPDPPAGNLSASNIRQWTPAAAAAPSAEAAPAPAPAASTAPVSSEEKGFSSPFPAPAEAASANGTKSRSSIDTDTVPSSFVDGAKGGLPTGKGKTAASGPFPPPSSTTHSNTRVGPGSLNVSGIRGSSVFARRAAAAAAVPPASAVPSGTGPPSTASTGSAPTSASGPPLSTTIEHKSPPADPTKELTRPPPAAATTTAATMTTAALNGGKNVPTMAAISSSPDRKASLNQKTDHGEVLVPLLKTSAELSTAQKQQQQQQGKGIGGTAEVLDGQTSHVSPTATTTAAIKQGKMIPPPTNFVFTAGVAPALPTAGVKGTSRTGPSPPLPIGTVSGLRPVAGAPAVPPPSFGMSSKKPTTTSASSASSRSGPSPPTIFPAQTNSAANHGGSKKEEVVSLPVPEKKPFLTGATATVTSTTIAATTTSKTFVDGPLRTPASASMPKSGESADGGDNITTTTIMTPSLQSASSDVFQSPPDTVMRNAERVLNDGVPAAGAAAVRPPTVTVMTMSSTKKADVLRSMRECAETPKKKTATSSLGDGKDVNAQRGGKKEDGEEMADHAFVDGLKSDEEKKESSLPNNVFLRNTKAPGSTIVVDDEDVSEKNEVSMKANGGSQTMATTAAGSGAAVGLETLSSSSSTSSVQSSSKKSRREDTALVRVTKQLRQTMEEKTEALRRVALLEEQMMELRSGRIISSGRKEQKVVVDETSVLNELVSIAEREGTKAAITWAMEQLMASQQSQQLSGVTTPARDSHRFFDGGVSPPLMESPFSSPQHDGGSTLSVRTLTPRSERRSRRRKITPHPKYRSISGESILSSFGPSSITSMSEISVEGNDSNDGDNAKLIPIEVEYKFLRAAVRTVPDEYCSLLASYYVRRPYIDESQREEIMDAECSVRWEQHCGMASEEYTQNASVYDPETLEIMATIFPDRSVLTLVGSSTVRHVRSKAAIGKEGEAEVDCKVFENVDEMDRPLGCIIYIDGDGNEKEYWLDEIYEEALAARASYCSSILSFASVLQSGGEPGKDRQHDNVMGAFLSDDGTHVGERERRDTSASHQHKDLNSRHEEMNSVPRNDPLKDVVPVVKQQSRPEMVNVSVGTDDLFPPVAAEDIAKSKDGRQKSASAPAPKKDDGKSPGLVTKELDEPSHDVLSLMLAFFFRTIFSIVWFVCIRLPLKIISWTFIVVSLGMILALVWLYFADDNGAYTMGAGIDYNYNRPGIF